MEGNMFRPPGDPFFPDPTCGFWTTCILSGLGHLKVTIKAMSTSRPLSGALSSGWLLTSLALQRLMLMPAEGSAVEALPFPPLPSPSLPLPFPPLPSPAAPSLLHVLHSDSSLLLSASTLGQRGSPP